MVELSSFWTAKFTRTFKRGYKRLTQEVRQRVETVIETLLSSEDPRKEGHRLHDPWEAKRMVDEFCEDVNLDGLLQIGARKIVGSGNSFWEKIEPDRLDDVKILPLTSIEKRKRDIQGNLKDTYSQRHMEEKRFRQRG